MAINLSRPLEAFELDFEVHSTDQDGVARVLLNGELDMAAVPLLEQECKRIEDRGSRIATLDLRGLTFIDAVGLRAVLSIEEGAGNAGETLAVINASRAVRRVFALTSNSKVLDEDFSPLPASLNGNHRA